MSRGRKIALNTAWLSMAQLAGAIAGLFVVGYVADKLTPAGYGELEGVTSFVTLFTPIIFLGIQLILIREVCSKPDVAAQAVGDAMTLRAMALPLFAGSIMLVGPWVIPDLSFTLLLLGITNYFFVYYLQCFELTFEAFERMHFMAFGTLSCYLVGMTMSVVAVELDWGPEGVMAARTLAVLTQTTVLAISLRAVYFAPKFKPNLKRYRSTLRQGLPLLASMALNLYLLEFGRTTLASTRSPEEVGLYSSAASLSSKFILFVHALTQATQPAICKAWVDGPSEYAELLGRVLRFVLILTLPMAFGSFFVADELVVFIFGDQYIEAGTVMAILLCAIHLQFLSSVLNASVVARGKENLVIIGSALAVGVNITLAVSLIPTTGLISAALITVASQAVLVVFFLAVQRDSLTTVLKQLKLPRVLLANTSLAGVCFALQGQNAIIIIGGAASVYGIAIVLLRCIDREEIRAITGR